MTESLDSYSSLQSLLLFQALAAYGTHCEAFETISTSLKQCELFHGREDADDDRLSPQALKDLYVKLVKEAAKARVDQEKSPGKRKARQSRSPSLEDTAHDETLIPGLIPKLYAHYRERITHDIREDERKYDNLVVETRRNEEEAKEKIHNAEAGTVKQLPAKELPVTAQPMKPVIPEGDEAVPESTEATSHDTTKPDKARPAPSPKLNHAPEKPRPRTSNAHTSIASIINHEPSDTATRPTSGPGVGPSKPSLSPSQNSATPLHSTAAPSIPSQAPYPPPPGSPATLSRTAPSQSRPSPYSHPEIRSDQSLQNSPRVPNVTSRSPTSNVILPPPPGVTLPFPPTSPWTHSNDIVPSHRRPPEPMSPRHMQAPPPAYGYEQTAQYQPSTPYSDPWRTAPNNQVPLSSRHSPPGSYMPHQQVPAIGSSPAGIHQGGGGGVMLPPFQVTPQAPSPTFQHPMTRQIPPPPPPPPGSYYPPAPRVQPKHAPDPLKVRKSESMAEESPFRTPMSGVAPKVATVGPNYPRLVRPGVTMSPGSNTAWRVFPVDKVPNSVARPTSREISPISDPEMSPRNKSTQRTSRKNARRSTEPEPTPSKSQKALLSRGKGPARHGRSGSLTSQAKSVKKEPSTPASERPDSLASQDPDTSAARSTRTIRGPQSKRKRADVETPPPSSPTMAPNTVVVSRNFAKMSIPIIGIISSHKHASLFAAPVRERDAEGYASMIRRPTDLKSIRAAITAGAKAVNAAVAASGDATLQASPGGPGAPSTGATVTLPVSDALVPPKGIVNAAQLEQEVMRMFANAVMFNPGDEGVVRDTREMFEAVQQSLGAWRGAENMDEMGNAGGSVGGEDEGGGGSVAGKRRRI